MSAVSEQSEQSEQQPHAEHEHAPPSDEDYSVSPLELFFDLVFVFAFTQVTALMAKDLTGTGMLRGIALLLVVWWAWVGYSWLTSTVDPEEGAVRIVIFAAMAALLVIASQLDGVEQGALWLLALALDMAGPYFFGSEGWRIVPEHFAERHGLIMIIALGESIVAIGVGAEETLTFGISVAAVLGIALACTLWWAYFDVVALVAARRLANATPGREQNEIARDSFSYLHFPMVAGIVLLALGLKKTIGHVDEPLKIEVATAMLGGLGVYLLAHVAFRWRNVHRFSTQRLVTALVLAALIPLAVEIPAIATLAIATAVMTAMILYELWRFREFRDRLRHGLPIHPEPEPEPVSTDTWD